MLNVNSPTVQAMISNTPAGFGNMPVYYGNAPTVEQTVQPVNAGSQIPYPSPKEMLTQGGQQMVYAPTSFAPRNIVGGYNPGYNVAFAGYSNPYMGYGYYGGIYNPNMYMPPMDEDSRIRLEAANLSGLTYEEQLKEEVDLYKTISRIVSKNVGRSEEDAKACEEAFQIIDKYPKEDPAAKKKYKPLHIQLKVGETVVADMNPEKVEVQIQGNYYARNSMFVEEMKHRSAWYLDAKIREWNRTYENAPERQFDKFDNLIDFFNNGAGVLMADHMQKVLFESKRDMVKQAYDSAEFRKRLLANNGLKDRSQRNAVERFAGRYGVMPDGRPVSPGHDPAVASSFSYDAKTGMYNVTAPNFIRDRMERARQSFIQSVDQN